MTLVQAQVRCAAARRDYRVAQQLARDLQRLFRRMNLRRKQVIRIQQLVRRTQARRKLFHLRIEVQSRSIRTCQRLIHTILAAHELQVRMQRFLGRVEIAKNDVAAALQRIYRGRKVRMWYRGFRQTRIGAAVSMQGFCRRVLRMYVTHVMLFEFLSAPCIAEYPCAMRHSNHPGVC